MVGAVPNGDAILQTRAMLEVGAVIGALLVAHWTMRSTHLEAVVARMPRTLVATAWTLMLSAILLTQGSGNAFIYFQF